MLTRSYSTFASSMLRLSRRACSTLSFVARAKEANDPKVLLGPFRSTGCFDAALDGMEIIHIGPDGAVAEFMVTKANANNFGTLHGGAIALVVDVLGTLALLGRDPSRAGVSVDMNQSFLAAAKIGDRVSASSTVLRYGRSVGFTQIDLRTDGPQGRLIATGRHTKYFTS